MESNSAQRSCRLYIDAALLNKPSASLSNPDQDVPQPSEREEDEPQ